VIVLAVLAPGQGAQKPGFLTGWLDLPQAAARLRWWSALTGLDLIHLGTAADADEIRDTARTQPLLVASALLAAEQLPLYDAGLLAGHSVGELAAACLAGVLTPEAAVTLAAVRGREMGAACALEPTGMAVVMGGDSAEVAGAVEAAGLYPANYNGAGQLVVAGAVEALAKLAAVPPARSRVITLKVAGAFHSRYMAPAQAALGTVAAGIVPADPQRILLSNLDGTAVSTGREVLVRLVRQVTSPVRWDLCMQTMEHVGVTAIVELPPAGTLAGLAKRTLRGVEIVAVNTPDDLAAARDLFARHGVPPSGEPGPQFRVVVAGAGGTFAPAADLAEGTEVHGGQLIGHITTRQGDVEVTVAQPGVLTEWLAHHDDPVAAGQPLARIGGSL